MTLTRPLTRAITQSITRRLTDPGAGGGFDILSNELDGFAIDFTNATDADRVTSKVGGIITRSSAVSTLALGLGVGIPTRVTNPDGTRQWAAHNLFVGPSGSPGLANRDHTVIVGQTYTVFYDGSGSLTLSGAATQSMSPGVPYTFVATTSTLTVGTQATNANVQVCIGSEVTSYVATVNQSVITAPISWDAQLGCYVLLVEPRGNNYFLYSGSPVTQAVSLPANTYTVWIDGVSGDSVTVSGGPSGVATPGVPFTFTIGSTTSVTFTVAGSPTHVQVENGQQPTSQIITFGSSQIRYECNPNVLFTAMTAAIQAANTAGSAISLYVDYAYTNASGQQEIIASIGTNAGTDFLDARINLGNPQVYRRRSGDAQVNWSLLSKTTLAADGKSVTSTLPTLSATERHQVTLNIEPSQIYGSSNGAQIGYLGTKIADLPTPGASLWFGTLLGANFLQGPMRIARVAVVAGATGPDRICSRFTQVPAISGESFNVAVAIGQSNAAGNAAGDVQVTGGAQVLQQLQAGGALAPTVEPLDNPIPVFGATPFYTGVILPLVKDKIIPAAADTTRWVILPEAVGNSGFGGTNEWGVGKSYHNNAVSALDSLRLRYPNARLSFLFVSRGEYDAVTVGMNEATYAGHTDAEINAWRTAYGAGIPVVIDTPQPGYVASNSSAFAPILAAIFDTPSRLAHVGIADESALASNPSDPAHFNIAQNNGPRRDNIYSALLAAQA